MILLRRLSIIVFIIGLFSFSDNTVKGYQPDPQDERIDQIIEEMSIEEKVGQLFMVELYDSPNKLGPEIKTLIQEYKVGAVILLAANNNFSNVETEIGSTPRQVAELTRSLQAVAAPGSNGNDGTSFYAPLLIAVDHEGDGWPYTRLRSGFTPIPSNMAIGATWSERHAANVGQVVGQELAAVGINLLLGPVIDVLPLAASTDGNDQGVRLMGANPFWVGKLGRAYIRGVHEGSNHQVATVAKHFPGHGSSDRLPDEEVAFLNLGLEELKQNDLRPFSMVSQCDQQDPGGTTDGIMSSHIEYKLSGGGRSGPVSIDLGAMNRIINKMATLDNWCEFGFVLVDTLGANAILKYYEFKKGEPKGSFNHRRIAKDALLAGNDMLMLQAYGPVPSTQAKRYQVMEDTIQFFQSEYQDNRAFKDHVDRALRRILRLKLSLYPSLAYEEVQIDPDNVDNLVGTSESTEKMDELAEQAITIIEADPDFKPPQKRERILIVSDSFKPPFADPPRPPLETNAIEEIIVELYGPQESGLVDPDRLTSWSFDDLAALLDASGEGDVPDLHGNCGSSPIESTAERSDLEEADWIILAMPDLVKCGQGDLLVKAFLRSNLLNPDHEVVVLALGAPYYLDNTDIAKLTAYFGVYTKVPSGLRAGAKALFGEIEPHQAHPVNIRLKYSLADQLKPDRNQVWGVDTQPALTEQIILEEDPLPIRLETTPLLDYNGHVVPDGTGVSVRLFQTNNGQLLRQEWSDITVAGVASIDVTVPGPGDFTLRITPEDFTSTESQEKSFSIVRPATPTPTFTPTPSPSPSPSPTPTSITGEVEPTTTPVSTVTPAQKVTSILTPQSSEIAPPAAGGSTLPPGAPQDETGDRTGTETDKAGSSPLAEFINSPGGVALISALGLIIAAVITGWFSLQKMGRIPPLTRQGKLNSYRNQLKQQNTNLLRLEERAAQFGTMNVPTSLANEIEATKARIEELRQMLADLSSNEESNS